MTTREQPFESEDLSFVEHYSLEGLQALAVVDPHGEPKAIVQALSQHIDDQRPHVKQRSEDDYGLFMLSMACLWGQQVCRAYQWEWVWLHKEKDTFLAIVSPDRSFTILPYDFIRQFTDDVDRPTTIMLLFNMLPPHILASKIPQAHPGEYTALW